MDQLDFQEAFIAFDNSVDNNQRLSYIQQNTWPPLTLDSSMSQPTTAQSSPSRRANTIQQGSSSQPTTSSAPLQSSGLGYPLSTQSLDRTQSATALLTTTADWPFQFQQATQQSFLQDAGLDTSQYSGPFGGPLQTSPIDFMSTTQGNMNTSLPFDGTTASYIAMSAPMDNMGMFAPAQFENFINGQMGYANEGLVSTDMMPSSVAGSSPTDNWLEVRSLSSSDNGWNTVDIAPSRQSFESFDSANFINPIQTLHIRTNSDVSNSSDVPPSAHSFSSWEEIQPFPMHSPLSENNLDFQPQLHQHIPLHQHDCAEHMSRQPTRQFPSPIQSVSPPALPPIPIKQSASSSSSPSSSGVHSPPSRRRKSPTGGVTSRVTKTIIKKTPSHHSTKKDNVAEKRVGRRRGPLRPDQRQQAHEIRKLGACLRCKFLKKTCDKGDPCGGCQPSHARLWQVPCTRIDIKDIAYFMKDWKADFERHVSLGFSVGNIKGFSNMERPLYITHGYGYYLPITAREVYVRDDKCFGVDWVESIHEKPKEFEVTTAKLSAGMEGIPHALLSEYLDHHIDGGFERFVDEYFEGTLFLTELLKTAYRYYLREKLPVIRKALKLVLAYNLTLHVTMVEGLSEEEGMVGKIDTNESKFFGKTVAPVMINFQVKCAMADMWRELQKDILEELSALFSSVYSGEKLKNWPTIFMLAAILLAIWEEMQFDCHYRVPDQAAAQKFCADMEGTPVGVIVGLFQAISQKLPSFMEWDTRKHHHFLNSNPAVCDAMTEVRAHVSKYESYLKTRSEAKFDRNDFDSLSNKFLSKLVIRAN